MERINVVLRQEISKVLTTELRDPRLSSMASITRVDCAPDLSLAKVYVSVLGDDEKKSETLAGLKSASGFVRKSIRGILTLKSVPAFEFYIDESIEQGTALLALIDKVAPGEEIVGEH